MMSLRQVQCRNADAVGALLSGYFTYALYEIVAGPHVHWVYAVGTCFKYVGTSTCLTITDGQPQYLYCMHR